ncbi:MAG: FecR domain-containing protein [Deltaproteobacteria bacterium]|nr:FecR domain-containing protein [Deltaproteobacteria bacterium]
MSGLTIAGRVGATLVVVACALGAAAGSALAGAPPAEPAPCGGLRVADGVVELGEPLLLGTIEEPAAVACLQAIAGELVKRPAIRSVIVAARAVGGRGQMDAALASARFAAGKLAAFGVPEGRIGAVAPHGAPGEPPQLKIAFVERRPHAAVGQVRAVSGKAQVGFDLANLTNAVPGAILSPDSFLATGSGSVVVARLIDGSELRLSEDSAVRIGAVAFSTTLGRNVQLQLVRGYAEVRAREMPGPLKLVTGNAVAGVRGTEFRLAIPDETTSRLETLDGSVAFSGSRGTIFVPRGLGSRVDHSGFPEDARTLLLAPKIEEPVRGTRRDGDLLSWEPVAQAREYLIEFARDAQFTDTYWATTSDRPRMLVGPALLPGSGSGA